MRGPDAPGLLSLPLGDDDPGPGRPLPRHLVDELSCVASWLDAESGRVRIVHSEEPWSAALPRLPRFEPVPARAGPPAAETEPRVRVEAGE